MWNSTVPFFAFVSNMFEPDFSPDMTRSRVLITKTHLTLAASILFIPKHFINEKDHEFSKCLRCTSYFFHQDFRFFFHLVILCFTPVSIKQNLMRKKGRERTFTFCWMKVDGFLENALFRPRCEEWSEYYITLSIPIFIE